MVYDHLLSFLHTFVAIPCYTSVNVIVILWYSVPIIDRIDKLVDFMGFRPVWRPPLFWGVDPRFSKGSVSYVKLIQKKSEICQSQKNWDHFPKKKHKTLPYFSRISQQKNPSPPPFERPLAFFQIPRRPRSAAPRWRRMAICRNFSRPWRWRMTGRPSSAGAPGRPRGRVLMMNGSSWW